jgi:hypothetical protein
VNHASLSPDEQRAMLYVQGMRVSDLVFEDPECEGADLVLVPHAYAA